jgi:hypothetical protein
MTLIGWCLPRESLGMRSVRLLSAFVLAHGALVAPVLAEEPERARAMLHIARGQGTEHCINEPALKRAVEARLRREVFVADGAADVLVKLHLTSTDSGYRAHLELTTRDGAALGLRDLETTSDQCVSLDAPLALVLALLLDIPRDDIAGIAAAPQPEPTPLDVPEEELVAERQQTRLWLSALVTGAAFLLPGAALGPAVRLGVDGALPVELEFELALYLGASAERNGAGAEASLAVAGILVCPLALGSDRRRLTLCGGQHVGLLRAVGYGFDENYEQNETFYSLLGRIAWHERIGQSVYLNLDLGAAAPLTSIELAYRGAEGVPERLYRTPAAAMLGNLGVGAVF